MIARLLGRPKGYHAALSRRSEHDRDDFTGIGPKIVTWPLLEQDRLGLARELAEAFLAIQDYAGITSMSPGPTARGPRGAGAWSSEREAP